MTTPVEQAFDIGLLGDGSNTVFPYTFIAYPTTGFRVFTQNIITQFVTERSAPNDYTVTYNATNTAGTLVFTVAPLLGDTVNIFRDSPRDQLVTYIENSAFPAKNLENQLDKITRISQEISSTYFAALSPFDPSIFLVGPTGPAGRDGDPGVDGINGVDGPIGPQGTPGIDGTNGADGAKGDPGTDGTNGVDGAPGTDGTNGTDGEGVEAGGTTDQVLVKNSDVDYDTKWETVSGALGQNNTASTAGTGAALTLPKNILDLPFKSITGGFNIQLEENPANIVISTDATVNASNATLLARANHTGTQLASTISDFGASVASNAAVALNTTKQTNATHTGDVTGAYNLEASVAMVNRRASVGPTGTNQILVADGLALKRMATSTVLARSAHTGTQLASTISDFDAAVESVTGMSGGKNLLINGRFLINQRNFNGNWSALANGVYGFDRWKRHPSGIQQIIEGGWFLPGEYVISWQGGGTGQVNGVAVASGDTFIVTNVNLNISIVVPFTANLIQVEKGTTATEFEIVFVGAELAACQRYYYILRTNGRQLFCCMGVAWGDLNLYTTSFPQNPTVMRAIPSVIFTGGVTGYISAGYNLTGIVPSIVSNRGIQYGRTTTTGVNTFDDGSAVMVLFRAGVSCSLSYNAEL